MQPNPSMMLEHLNLMFGRVATEYPGGRVEIRCLHPDTGRPDAHTFDASTGLKDAAEYAEENNRNGLNIYFGINPRMPSVAPFGACSKVDVDAAFFSCADLDDQKSYTRYKESNNLKPSFVVVTGTIPDKRGHLYFEHEDICRNLDAWKGIQCGIIDHYASDPHIKDTPRIMRLAGSISYPSKKKAEKGYVAEIVKLIKLDGTVAARAHQQHARVPEAHPLVRPIVFSLSRCRAVTTEIFGRRLIILKNGGFEVPQARKNGNFRGTDGGNSCCVRWKFSNGKYKIP